MTTQDTTNELTTRRAGDVTITLDLAAFARGYYEDTPDAITNAVAEKITAEIVKDVRAAVQDQIRQQAQKIVADTIEAGITPTNHYGEPIGEAKTLRELIADEAAAWMKRSPREFGSRDDKSFYAFLSYAVDQSLRQDLRKTVEAARKEVTARIAAGAGEVFAEAMKRGLPT